MSKSRDSSRSGDSRRDADEFDDIPPMVPPRDELDSRQRERGQPDLVNHGRYADRVVVSSWPMRIALAVLAAVLLGGGVMAYMTQQENLAQLEQASRRIADLENRLSSVGNSAEETTANIIERLDFNFSEIDKLWAARNATNSDLADLTGRVANIQTATEENTTMLEETNQRLVRTTNLVEDNRDSLNTLRNEVERDVQRMASLQETVNSLQNRIRELMSLRESLATLENAEGATGGLNDRLARLEEAVEAIDAYRLQMNQTILRLQQNIEALEQ